MDKILKDRVIKFSTTFLYWFALLLVLIMIEGFMGFIAGPLRASQGLIFLFWMTIASLFLAVYSMFVPPVRYFLEAQFEHGKLEESLELVHENVKELKTEVNEIKQIINELVIQNDEKKNRTPIA